MVTFTDSTGRTWNLSFTFGDFKRLKELGLDAYDLFKDQMQVLAETIDNHELLIKATELLNQPTGETPGLFANMAEQWRNNTVGPSLADCLSGAEMDRFQDAWFESLTEWAKREMRQTLRDAWREFGQTRANGGQTPAQLAEAAPATGE